MAQSRSSSRSRAQRWATLAVEITRAPDSMSLGSSSCVSRNGARWFDWKVRSCPSTVSARVGTRPPALFASTSMRSHANSRSSARVRTSSSRSKSAMNATPPTSVATASARARWRPTTAIRAPRPASSIAACLPMPELAPVITTVLPVIERSMLVTDSHPSQVPPLLRSGCRKRLARRRDRAEPGRARSGATGRGAPPRARERRRRHCRE